MKKKLTLLLSLSLSLSSLAFAYASDEEGNQKIVLVHTNDVHCAIENGVTYAGVAAYTAEMKELYGEEFVTLIDAGDAIQGGPLGTLTQGSALIEIMNAVGYDIFTPGNHEFDYGTDRYLELAAMTEAQIIASNFLDINTKEPLFDPYIIESYGDIDIAYVGVITPDTFTTSTPSYFQDDNGNYLYTFCEDQTGATLYENVQASIDSAISDGADYVVLVGHVGMGDDSADTEAIIANTTGVDIYIDGHSHSIVENRIMQNKNGEDVVLNQAGDKLNFIGKIVIDPVADTISAELVADYEGRDESILSLMTDINAEFDAMLDEVVAVSEVDLASVRTNDSNLSNLLADAYKIMLGTDIGLVNAGGVRAPLAAGDITYRDLINVQPFSNDVSSVRVSGQVILDALEHGAKSSPEGSGGFLLPSGLTYNINNQISSSVVTDDKGNFLSVDGEYRVNNVLVGDEPLDVDKTYSVSSHNYLLHSGGDGMTMFADAEIIVDMFMIDNEMLIKFMDEHLGGVISDPYLDPNGQGRITLNADVAVPVAEEVVAEEVVAEETVVEEVVAETPVAVTTPVTTVSSSGTYKVVENDSLWKIAQSQLGKGSRFNEIYELNKDIIDSPSMIFIGQELKMPV